MGTTQKTKNYKVYIYIFWLLNKIRFSELRPGSYCSQEVKDIEFTVPETSIKTKRLLIQLLI